MFQNAIIPVSLHLTRLLCTVTEETSLQNVQFRCLLIGLLRCQLLENYQVIITFSWRRRRSCTVVRPWVFVSSFCNNSWWWERPACFGDAILHTAEFLETLYQNHIEYLTVNWLNDLNEIHLVQNTTVQLWQLSPVSVCTMQRDACALVGCWFSLTYILYWQIPITSCGSHEWFGPMRHSFSISNSYTWVLANRTSKYLCTGHPGQISQLYWRWFPHFWHSSSQN